MAYSSWSVVAGEIPTASKWNILGTNDASFNDGTGIGTNAIAAASLATSAITLGYAEITSSITTTSSTAVQATGLSVSVTIPSGSRRIVVWADVGTLNASNNVTSNIGVWDGTVGSGTNLNNRDFINTAGGFRMPVTVPCFVTPAAGSKTYNVSFHCSGGTLQITASSTYKSSIWVGAV